MDPTIKKLLNENRVEGEYFHTHVSLFQPRGAFQFNRQNLEKFWNVYCTYVQNTEDPMIGVAEKPQHNLPVIVDVDLKVRDDDQEMDEKLYTDEQLRSVVEVYQSTIRKIVEGCTEKDLICVVLEKPMYSIVKNDVTYYKNGFHLHFPYCFLSKIDQEVQLIPRVREKVQELKIFSNLGYDDSSKTIDKSCCKVPWLLYGSKKSEDSKAYKVTKVYNSEMNEISLKKAFKHYQIYNEREELINIRDNLEYYLPRILSIIPYGREEKALKHGLISPLKEKVKSAENKIKPSSQRQHTIEEALSIARRLLPMLNDFRADDRNEWMTIGWILYNISNGDAEGLELWCDFSARCVEKFDESICIYHWERMVRKDLTLGTLRYYANLDNPIEYKKFKDEQSDRHIKESLNGSHNDVAKALYAEYGDEFVCASISNRTWYQFINHKWELIEEGVFLREKISDQIVYKYINSVKDLYDRLGKCTDKAEEGMLNARIKQVQKMISNLKSSTFKNNVMREAMEVFYDKRFYEKLDTDPYIIAFKNGVYDLKLNIFRPGRPEDFLSKCMPINYVHFREEDEKVQEIHSFLEKIFPNKDIRKYFLDVYSEIFVGGNHEKIVPFWTGEGDNGKSIMQKFFETMLGPFAISISTTVITGKKAASNAASPELARAGGGVRLVILAEPNHDEQLNVGLLKHLSGNDSYYARDLFEKGKGGREIIPLFKLVIICNDLPKMKFSDKATWNRVRIILFESTFCSQDDPSLPKTYEEQLLAKKFPCDRNFGKKIPELVEAFAWVLLQHRQKMTKRFEPREVTTATENYRKANDLYRQFAEECLVEDEEKTLDLTTLYAEFKLWFRESLPGFTVPVKLEVENYFTRAWGFPESGKRWTGWRIRTQKDKIEAGDIVIVEDHPLPNDNPLLA